jgi:DNA-binding beta-propeller fold protein YncE
MISISAMQVASFPAGFLSVRRGVVFFAVLVGLALTASPAMALETHVFSKSFGGSGASALSDPAGVAVAQSTGEVYVVDSTDDRVEIFSASGAFISAFGGSGSADGQLDVPSEIAVDSSGGMPGDVYVLDAGNGRVEAFNAKGQYQAQVTKANLEATSPPGGVGALEGIAVDATGNLLIADSNGNVYEFPSGGALPGSLRFALGYGRSAGMATDASGDIYLSTSTPARGSVAKYNANGKLQGGSNVDECGCATGIAVDPASEDLYVDGGNRVEHFLASNTSEIAKPNDSFGLSNGPSPLVYGAGLAVNTSTGAVYVAEAASASVDVFIPATLPDVTTEAATAVGKTTASLQGRVDPDGIDVSSCEFQYKIEAEPSYTHSVPCEQSPAEIGKGTSPVTVTAELTALEPGTSYRYRLVATNATDNATNSDGREESLTTSPAVDALTTGPVENLTGDAATLTGSLSPDGSDAHYYFQYGTSTTYGSTSPALPGTDAGNGGANCLPPGGVECSAVAAERTITGLGVATAYHYRLVATNSFGTTYGEDMSFTTLGPSVTDESSTEITATSGTLDATINPNKVSTTYYFEYGTTSGYGTSIPAQPGESIGAGEEGVQVNQHIQGLLANTIYHYRTVAVGELQSGEPAEFDGPDHTLTTQGASTSAGLLDGRRWELVSSPNKHGAAIEPIGAGPGITQAAADGSAITYLASGPTEAGAEENAGRTQVLSTRDGESGSWQSKDVGAPHIEAVGSGAGAGEEYRFFSPNLSRGLLQPVGTFNAGLSPEASEQTPFLRDLQTGTYTPLVTGCPKVDIPCAAAVEEHADVPPGTVFGDETNHKCPLETLICGAKFVAASPDLSHVVVRSRAVSLTADAEPGEEGLYEWGDGSLTFLGDETHNAASVGGEASVFAPPALSADGSRVVFDGSSHGLTGLLMRDSATNQTLQLDTAEPACVSEGCASGGGVFQGASTDMAKVYFTDEHKLTKDGGANVASPDLYLFEIVDTGACTESSANYVPPSKGCLTDVTPVTNGEAADVQGHVLGVSENGSRVYFVADGKLGAARAVNGNCTEHPGSEENSSAAGAVCNVFVVGVGEAARLVAVVSGEDYPDWNMVSPESRVSRVSPDGEWLAFMSEVSLTDYDNHDAVNGRLDEEVFLYHAAGGGGLVCASCDPTGARPVGVEYGKLEAANSGLVGGVQGWAPSQMIAGIVPGWTAYRLKGALVQPRYLDDGGRLFFDSSDALVPQDANRTEDVYELEPPQGAGQPASNTCTAAASTYSVSAGGCIGLISSGTSDTESAFLEGSESGDDVFLLTAAQLSTRDVDTSLDVYDARVGGGEAEVARPVECQGDACQSSVSAPEDPTPGSLTFQGPGNLAAPVPVSVPKKATKKAVKCKAPQKASHGKCVRPKPRKKRKAGARKANRDRRVK